MRIAVVGTGIAGMVAARLAQREHEVTVFEASDWVGGHAHTVDVANVDGPLAVDTGFLVHNRPGYPELTRLFDELGVATQESDMSFSVRCERTGLEYNGTSLNSLFAQRRNLFRPSFHRMIRDILRFYREAPALAERSDPGPTLGEYLEVGGYSTAFIEHHALPMGAAIWSAPSRGLRDFPAKYFVRFFQQHGFLQVNDRPCWRTVTGGSREYVRLLTASYRDRIRLSCPVERITRFDDRVEVWTRDGGAESFDHAVLALHSDQALRLLADPSPTERELLSAIPYQENDVVLHHDTSLLPRRPLARASWNVHLIDPDAARVAVTYDVSRLQRLRGPERYLVTLNHADAIRDDRVLRRFTYHHPVYTAAGFAAQERHAEISGVNRTHYCGAYWGYGFHEDGVVSALRAWERFEETTRREELSLSGMGPASAA
ncbi:MAG: FAD-dependent oxidoreductase [Acidobacteriota bacterium]